MRILDLPEEILSKIAMHLAFQNIDQNPDLLNFACSSRLAFDRLKGSDPDNVNFYMIPVWKKAFESLFNFEGISLVNCEFAADNPFEAYMSLRLGKRCFCCWSILSNNGATKIDCPYCSAKYCSLGCKEPEGGIICDQDGFESPLNCNSLHGCKACFGGIEFRPKFHAWVCEDHFANLPDPVRRLKRLQANFHPSFSE